MKMYGILQNRRFFVHWTNVLCQFLSSNNSLLLTQTFFICLSYCVVNLSIETLYRRKDGRKFFAGPFSVESISTSRSWTERLCGQTGVTSVACSASCVHHRCRPSPVRIQAHPMRHQHAGIPGFRELRWELLVCPRSSLHFYFHIFLIIIIDLSPHSLPILHLLGMTCGHPNSLCFLVMVDSYYSWIEDTYFVPVHRQVPYGVAARKDLIATARIRMPPCLSLPAFHFAFHSP